MRLRSRSRLVGEEPGPDPDLTRLYATFGLSRPYTRNLVCQILDAGDIPRYFNTLKGFMEEIHKILLSKNLYTHSRSGDLLIKSSPELPALGALMKKKVFTWPQLARAIERCGTASKVLTDAALIKIDNCSEYHPVSFPCIPNSKLVSFLRNHCNSTITNGSVVNFSDIHGEITDYIHSNPSTRCDIFETVFVFCTPLEELFGIGVFPERGLPHEIAGCVYPVSEEFNFKRPHTPPALDQVSTHHDADGSWHQLSTVVEQGCETP